MAIVLYSAQKQAASFELRPGGVNPDREQDPTRTEIMEGIDALLALAGSLEGSRREWTSKIGQIPGELSKTNRANVLQDC